MNGKNLPDAHNLRKLAELAGEDSVWLFRQVGYLPPQAENTSPHASPALSRRAQEIVSLFNRLAEAEQDLEIAALRLRVGHVERRSARQSPNPITTESNGPGASESATPPAREHDII